MGTLNLAIQARFLMALAWLLLAASMLVLASLGLSAPLAFVAICLLALLGRIIRRFILWRLGLVEVENGLCRSDPLGPMIDQLFERESEVYSE